MGWESFDVIRFDLNIKRARPNLKVLVTRLLLILEVCNVKPTHRKSWAGNLLMLDLTFPEDSNSQAPTKESHTNLVNYNNVLFKFLLIFLFCCLINIKVSYNAMPYTVSLGPVLHQLCFENI